jgi:hypothetical protein
VPTLNDEPVANLVKLPTPAYPVMLKSGSPPMNLICTEGGRALCETLPEWTASGKRETVFLPVACLYACVPLADHLAANPLPEGEG